MNSTITRSPRRPITDWLALIAIVLLAAVLRFWNLGGMPPGFYHDEAYNGLDAISLVEGREFPLFYEGWELYSAEAHGDNPPTPTRFPLFFEGNYGREPLHIYLMALSVKLFGATPQAVRAVPALAGVLAVVTTFFSADALLANTSDRLRRYAPLFAAFALAILFPAIHFSRFGLRAMLFVPVETLAVYCFWRGLEHANRKGKGTTIWFVLTGALLGFGLYVYAAARLFPLLFAGYIVVWFWRDRTTLKKHFVAVLLMIGTAIVVAMPLLLYFARYPYFFVFRTAYVANKGVGAVEGRPLLTWLSNIGRVVRGFFWHGETHLRHNLPGRPYLDLIQAVFFAVGLVFASIDRRLRGQGRALFLFLWLAVMLLATIMSGDAPHFGRMTGAAPVVAIFIGIGAFWLLDLLGTRIGKWAIVVIVGLFAASTVWTVYDYFSRYASHPQLEADFYLPDWELGQAAASFSAETSAFLSPNQAEMATIFFALGGDTDRLQSYDGLHRLIPRGANDTVYFVCPDDVATLTNLQTAFPNAIVDTSGNGYVTLSVSAESPHPQPTTTINHLFDDAIELIGYDTVATDSGLEIRLFWQALRDLNVDYTAFVHVLDADDNIIAQSDRPPQGYPTRDWQAGQIIMDSFTVDVAPDATSLRFGFYDSAELTPLGEPIVVAK